MKLTTITILTIILASCGSSGTKKSANLSAIEQSTELFQIKPGAKLKFLNDVTLTPVSIFQNGRQLAGGGDSRLVECALEFASDEPSHAYKTNDILQINEVRLKNKISSTNEKIQVEFKLNRGGVWSICSLSVTDTTHRQITVSDFKSAFGSILDIIDIEVLPTKGGFELSRQNTIPLSAMTEGTSLTISDTLRTATVNGEVVLIQNGQIVSDWNDTDARCRWNWFGATIPETQNLSFFVYEWTHEAENIGRFKFTVEFYNENIDLSIDCLEGRGTTSNSSLNQFNDIARIFGSLATFQPAFRDRNLGLSSR